MTKTAVILFNQGGPDTLDAVEPFLFNLFNDPAIIDAPGPVRYCLARWISWRRSPVAKHIYEQMGGSSPLLSQTRAQSDALDLCLNEGTHSAAFKSFIVMRYWHPMSDPVAAQVKEYGPDNIILLPLYPQYSTTTTGSSIKDWNRAAKIVGLEVPTTAVCCYPVNVEWITAQCDLVVEQLSARQLKTQIKTPVRILFSAHGLPKKIIEKGDPYQHQVEQTAAALAGAIADRGHADLDWAICYQSRVGPLEWIGPSTEDEIARAARDGLGIVVVPVAFVSEHSETLVELDIEYRDMAKALGVTDYTRIAAVGTSDQFIRGLAGLVEKSLVKGGLCQVTQTGNIAPQFVTEVVSDGGQRLCPRNQTQCPQIYTD